MITIQRPSGRQPNEIRELLIETNVSKHAHGSCLIKCGDTHVFCTASVEDSVPFFLRGKNQGWLTAEYSMLPGSTSSRIRREAAQGKQSGRTQEIQRLIGRSLRACINLKKLGERQITIDCDVLQADGGTRTASITGGFVALNLAINRLINENILKQNPIIHQIAAISCGIVSQTAVADLDYIEDSNAEVDANFVMTHDGHIIEVQGTAEGAPFTPAQLTHMMTLASDALPTLARAQHSAIQAKDHETI